MDNKNTNQVLTVNGYDMFEVVSAMQKSIRRGKEEDAMYWGVELFESGMAPYAWKRLIIIAMEDIGLANPDAIVQIKTLKDVYDTMTKEDKKGQYRLPFVQAILYLVHSPKSRICDWALGFWFDNNTCQAIKKEIPDYALDAHTRRGKKMGKGIKEFFTEGSLLENHHPFSNEETYKARCWQWWTDKEWCKRNDEIKEQRNKAHENSRGNKDIKPNTNFDGQTSLF